MRAAGLAAEALELALQRGLLQLARLLLSWIAVFSFVSVAVSFSLHARDHICSGSICAIFIAFYESALFMILLAPV